MLGSLIWLLAGVGVFIVGMNFMSDALERSAGVGMKRMLEKISNALREPYNLSETFRLMISREYVALRKQGLINGGCYEPGF